MNFSVKEHIARFPAFETQRSDDEIFKPIKLSDVSTPTVPDSVWFSADVHLGAGVVIIQPTSGKVVVISLKQMRKDEETGKEYEYEGFFLPKGRKDLGESLEDAALREGYEEVSRTYLKSLRDALSLIEEWV